MVKVIPNPEKSRALAAIERVYFIICIGGILSVGYVNGGINVHGADTFVHIIDIAIPSYSIILS